MKTGIKYFFPLVLLLCFYGNNIQAQQDSVKTLSLDDCIRLGLTQSAHVLRSQDSVQITGAALMGAYGQFLPDLSLAGNYGYLSGNNLLTTTEPTLVYARESQLNYQLTSSIDVFNGFLNQSTLKAAMLSQSASQYTLVRAKQQIAFDITQSYLQIMLDRRIVDYAQKNLDASTKREAQLQELTDVGRRAISDLYQQQAETSSDKLYLIQVEDKLKNDVILLLRKLRISQTDKYQVGTMVVDTLPLGAGYQDVQALVDTALTQRADLKSLALDVKMADWQIQEFRSGYMPKVYLQGGLVSNGGYFNQLYINGTNELGPQEPYDKALFGQFYGEVGLTVSWHIFDRFYNKANVDIATINERNQEIDYDDQMVQVSADVKQAYNDYLAALQQITTSNRGLIAATAAFNVIQGQYDVGRADFVTLSNSQVALLQAQVSKAQSDVNLALQKKIIDYYIGR